MLVCVSFYSLHARPRVQRAFGIPCSLFSGGTKAKARANHAARSRSRISSAPRRKVGVTASLDLTIAVKPHPEEPRSGVSKDESHGRAVWFETPAARAPHHEGEVLVKRC